MLRLSRWFAVAAVLFIPLSAGAQVFCPSGVPLAPAVALYTPAPMVSYYTPAASYSVAVTGYFVPGYSYAPSYGYSAYGYAPSYGYSAYGYAPSYGYGSYGGYSGYNPGGLGGPLSGLGVRPGLGFGGFGLRR